MSPLRPYWSLLRKVKGLKTEWEVANNGRIIAKRHECCPLALAVDELEGITVQEDDLSSMAHYLIEPVDVIRRFTRAADCPKPRDPTQKLLREFILKACKLENRC